MTLEASRRAAPSPTRPAQGAPKAPVRTPRPGRTAAWLARQVELGLLGAELSLPQYRVLSLLAEGSAVSSAVAQRLAVRPPSVTAVVDGLVAKGLVCRRPVEDDRRCVALALTESGTALLEVADQEVEERLRQLLGELSERSAGRALDGLELWRQAMVARARTASVARATSRGDR